MQWCAELERDRQQLLTDLDALRVHLHHQQQLHDVRDAESSRDVTARESRDQGGGGGDDVTGELAPAADTDTAAGRLVAAERAAARYRDALRRKVVVATVIHAARVVCEPGSL